MFRTRHTIIALALALSATAAEAQQGTTTPAAPNARAERQEGTRKRDGRMQRQPGRGLERAALRGVSLTDAQRQQLATLRTRQRTERLAILTPEQRAQVDANVKQMRARHVGQAKGKGKRGARKG